MKGGTIRGGIEVYRLLGHANAREACRKIKTRFNTPDVVDCANGFNILQKAREAANYAPDGVTNVAQVSTMIGFAENCIDSVANLSDEQTVDFAIFLLMKGKGVNDSRERWLKKQSNELFVSLNLSDDQSEI